MARIVRQSRISSPIRSLSFSGRTLRRWCWNCFVLPLSIYGEFCTPILCLRNSDGNRRPRNRSFFPLDRFDVPRLGRAVILYRQVHHNLFLRYRKRERETCVRINFLEHAFALARTHARTFVPLCRRTTTTGAVVVVTFIYTLARIHTLHATRSCVRASETKNEREPSVRRVVVRLSQLSTDFFLFSAFEPRVRKFARTLPAPVPRERDRCRFVYISFCISK